MPRNTDTIVKIEKMHFVKVSGRIVAQKFLSLPIETVLTRKGTTIISFKLRASPTA